MMTSRARNVAAVAIAISGLWASAAWSRPSMSRGEQFLDMTESDCITRARAAYAAAGWTDIANSTTWAKGHKGDYASYTTCNAVAPGRVVVNIFVAFGGSDPSGDLAGGERSALQTQMEKR